MKMKNLKRKHIQGNPAVCLAVVFMAVILAVSYLPLGTVYAAGTNKESSASEEAIREVHKVKVGNKRYCFFVTHNVVMTPKEVASFGDNDQKLTDEVLKRAGLYIKEENCRLEKHKAISPQKWEKDGGTISLSPVEIYEENEKDGDAADPSDQGDEPSAADAAGGRITEVPAAEALRKAAPTDGNPARFYMNLVITTETPKDGDSKEPAKYSTFRKESPNSPELIYVAVATEKDAGLGEEICEDKSSDSGSDEKKGKLKIPKDTGAEKELLPEERTISMADRSGGPLEPTLIDGNPVTLEWIESGRQTGAGNGQGAALKWAIPAGIAGILTLGAAAFLIARSRRGEKEEEE